ncbi:MAG: UbiA family prenyltransferase [Parvibaculum sp.]|nr:UbiA family prenyltransferase [Parvibaculum sp.]
MTFTVSAAVDKSDNAPAASARVPLCVDLDGTLVLSDTLVELFLLLIKRKPWLILYLPFWLLRGRAGFKAEIARRVKFDASLLPYRADLVDWLRAEAASGRMLVLASGANRRIVHAVADHFGFFTETFSSNEGENLKGLAKANALTARFGTFDYVGDAPVDVAVWRAARKSYLCVSSPSGKPAFGRDITFERVFPLNRSSQPLLWLRALRLHQWVKNVLMFVPLVLAHQVDDMQRLTTLILAFMAFNIAASSVYVLNDLLDLAADRAHPRKKHRPFAAGHLSLRSGLALWPVLLVASFALALYASPAFAAVLGVYYALTVAYSFELKRRALVDVFTLASLYTLRIIAGAVAASVVLSPWLLGFSVFIFLSLAIVKRVAELHSLHARGVTDPAGRGYHHADLAMLEILGVAAGYASVVVLALYVSAPESKILYVRHQLLWLFAPLVLFWISRVWLITHRGEMHDDPIVFALKDSPSRIVGLLAVLVLELAAF